MSARLIFLTPSASITAAATDAVGRLHDRMPMVVERANWAAWLDPGFGSDPSGLLRAPALDVEFYPVSTAVNRVGNDGPELLTPLPPLPE